MSHDFPAGTYYVGDLCYVLHEVWDEFCDLTIKDRECLDGIFTLADGRRFATFQTAWGDGEYQDQYGNRYGVDAGLIGVISAHDIDWEYPGNFSGGGNVVEFTEPFSVGASKGLIVIGHFKIDTDPEDEEWEDDEE